MLNDPALPSSEPATIPSTYERQDDDDAYEEVTLDLTGAFSQKIRVRPRLVCANSSMRRLTSPMPAPPGQGAGDGPQGDRQGASHLAPRRSVRGRHLVLARVEQSATDQGEEVGRSLEAGCSSHGKLAEPLITFARRVKVLHDTAKEVEFGASSSCWLSAWGALLTSGVFMQT
jgi:hypothetical protein